MARSESSIDILLSSERSLASSQPIKDEPNDTLIFLSPSATLCASVREHDPVSENIRVHDLVDAYSTLAAGFRHHIRSSRAFDASALGLPIRRHQLSELICAIRRDTRALMHAPAFDMTTENLCEQELEASRDIATLGHHALRLVSDIFAFSVLQALFTTKHLCSLLDDILTILFTPSLPSPHACRTRGLLLWILQVQRLDASVVIPHRERIVQVATHALDGVYKSGGTLDGLKMIVAYLRRPQRELQPCFVDLFEKSLSFLTSPSPAERFHAAEVISAFARSKMNGHLDAGHQATFDRILSPFLRAESQTAKDSDHCLTDLLRQALVTDRAPLTEGPQWAIVVIASVVVLLGASTINNHAWAEAAVQTLQQAVAKTPTNALLPLVWNYIIWSFSLIIPNDYGKDDGFEFLAQCLQSGSANALVSILLRFPPSCTAPSSRLGMSRALIILEAMAHDEDDVVRRDGVNLLARLLSAVGNSTVEHINDQYPTFLLHPALFDGTLLKTKLTSLEAITRFTDPVGTQAVRYLTEKEIEDNWDKIFEVWYVSLMKTLRESKGEIHKSYVDIWQSLLLVETHLTQEQMGHLTVPKEYVNHARETVAGFIKVGKLSLEAEVTQLLLLQGLWRALHNVFTTKDLKLVSGEILKDVVKHGFRIEEERILSEWMKLCHALAQNRSPVDDVDFSGSWVILARVINEVGQSPEPLIAFLRLPVTGLLTFVLGGCFYVELSYRIVNSRKISRSPLRPFGASYGLKGATPIHDILTTLCRLSPPLSLWIQDASKLITDDEYNRVVVPMYCKIVERLHDLEASVDTLTKLESLLLSPIERCPHPGTATQAFVRFWAAKYHFHTKDSHHHYSEDLKEALRCLDIVMHCGFATEFSQTTDSQAMDGSFIVPESIPMPSSPLRPQMTVEHNPTKNAVAPRSLVDINPSSSRKRKSDDAAESAASESTATRKKRKALVLDCVQLPSLSKSNRTITQGTKRSRESQLMTPETSRFSSTSPFRGRLPAKPPNDGEEYDWDSGNVSISDLKDVVDVEKALEPSSDANSEEGDQVGGDSSVRRPSKRRRREDYQSEPVMSSPSRRSKPSSSSRTRTVSSGAVLVSDLQRLARSFKEERITTQELLQAQKVIHSLGAAIHEALERQIGGSDDN
ncbi:hypothetical protein AAF712_003143 [Marasmius tenuissimus]|uniref:Telomere-associated protein Rif1 N-terminal domain-containing protein n=1 Tax=Marasmius tenuissimus TaxID=585030 RepID=A0ABR3AA32_9AGAR